MPFNSIALLNRARPRLSFRPTYHLNLKPNERRPYHDVKATLFDPGFKAIPITRAVDVKVGDPDEAYVLVNPEIGSILAGKTLPRDAAVEVPLVFFHRTNHFAIGSTPECARLELPVALPHSKTSEEIDATLFHFGLLSTIALNGTACERFARLASTTETGPGSTLDRLKDM